MSKEDSSDFSEEDIVTPTSDGSSSSLPSSRLPSTPSPSSEEETTNPANTLVDLSNQSLYQTIKLIAPVPGAINAVSRDCPAVTTLESEDHYNFRPIKAARSSQEVAEETLNKGINKVCAVTAEGVVKEKQVKFAKQTKVHLCSDTSSDGGVRETRRNHIKNSTKGNSIKGRPRYRAHRHSRKKRRSPALNSSSSLESDQDDDVPSLLPLRNYEMSGGAPWQMEGYNNQPPNNQVQFYNPNQFASGAKGANQENDTAPATGAESGHYADWQQQNYQNGYYGQQAGYYGQQDVNQQWNQDGNYVQTSQPGGAQVSGGGEGMYAGYEQQQQQGQQSGTQGGVAAQGAWNNVDPMQFWDNSYDYSQQYAQHPQQQQAYGEMSTMSSQPNDQGSSFSQDTEADAEVQAYTSGLGTQAGAAQLPQQPPAQPQAMQDVPLDEPAAAGHEAPPQNVNLTSAASFPSLGQESDPFATLNPADVQPPVPTWPQQPPVSQPQRQLNAQPDKSVHSRQSSAGGNVQFVLGGSEAGSTDNSHSNSPASFAKPNVVQGIIEEPHQQLQAQQQQHVIQQQHAMPQQHQQQSGDSYNWGSPQMSNSHSSGWAGPPEMQQMHQPQDAMQPPQPTDGQAAAAADEGWGWGEGEEDDVDELLRQHREQQPSSADASVSAAAVMPVASSESQVQPPSQSTEAQPPILPDQVVPQVPGESSRQEASLGAAVVAEEPWPEMVDSGLNAGEVPNQGQPGPYVGQGHPGDSPQVNPGPPVYQRSPSQTSVHSSHSHHSLPGSDFTPRKDRSYSSTSTVSSHSIPSVNHPNEGPPTPVQAPPPVSEAPPPGNQAPPLGGLQGPPPPGAGTQGDNPFRRGPGGNRFAPTTDGAASVAPQPPATLPVSMPPTVQPPNTHLASPLESHPDSPFQPPVKSFGDSAPQSTAPPGTPQAPQPLHHEVSHQHHGQHGFPSHRKRGSRDSTMSPATTLWENPDITVGKNVQLFSPSLTQQQEAAENEVSLNSSIGSGNAFFPTSPSNPSEQSSVHEQSTGSSANDQSYNVSNQSPEKNPAQNVSQTSQNFGSPQYGNVQQVIQPQQQVTPPVSVSNSYQMAPPVNITNPQQAAPPASVAYQQHQVAPQTSIANPQPRMAPVSMSEPGQQTFNPSEVAVPKSNAPPAQFASQAGVPSSQADGYHGNQGHVTQQQNTNVSHDTSNHSMVVQSQSQPIPANQPTFSPQAQNSYGQQQNVPVPPQSTSVPQQNVPFQGQEVIQGHGQGHMQGTPPQSQGQSNQYVSPNRPTPQFANAANLGQNAQMQNPQNWQAPVQNQPHPVSSQPNQGPPVSESSPQNQSGAPQSQHLPPQPQGPPQNQYRPPQAEGHPQNQYGPPQSQYGPPQSQYGPPQSQYGHPQPQDQSRGQGQNPYGPPQNHAAQPQSAPVQNQGPYNQQAPQQYQQGPPNSNFAPVQQDQPPTGPSGDYGQGQPPQPDSNRYDDQGQRSQPPIRFPGQTAPPGQRPNPQQTNRQASQDNTESAMNRSASMTDAERYSRDPYNRSRDYRDYYQSDPRYAGYDPYYRPPSRGGGYRDDYYRDYYGRDQYERPRSRQGQPDEYERPRSVTDYERPRSRQGQPEDRPRSRPASRQGEEYVSHSGSRPSSRSGREMAERPRSRNDNYDRDRRDPYSRSRSYQDFYDYYGRDYYGDYYDYYGYRRDERYSRGYYDEMRSYGQEVAGENDRNRYERSYSQENYSDRGSNRSSRSTTPSVETAADQFAREFHQGSRPSSRSSGYEQSPIHPADQARRDYYQDRSYGYDYDPRYDRHYDYYRDHHKPREPSRMTPVKFAIPHLRATFGPGGQLVQVLPNNPLEGQPARVTVQDCMHIMINTGLQEELKTFPGPLVKGETHKNDVLLFCQTKIQECKANTELIDQQSAELIWRYLSLLIKQNGTIIGTDVCDLLLEGHEPTTAEYAASGMSISLSTADFSDVKEGEVGCDKSLINRGALSTDDVTDRFRNLLLRGRKKDALEWAIKNYLWGHALFLASKMDTKTHASVMTRFANVSMKINDPLQTLYQLMSGRQPAAVTLMSEEKWGDWRPHLAMMLGNPTQRPDVDRKSVINLGDTLAAKGLLFASHFCYLMAQVPFGQYHKKSSKFVLIGSSHSLDFDLFATNEAIQCTEIFEYAISLGNPMFVLPTLQTYKLLYCYRLAENSMPEEALRYSEVLATTICQNPVLYQAQMVQQAYDLSTRLKYYDPERLQASDDDHTDPVWLVNLGRVVKGFQDGSIQTVSGTQTPMGYHGYGGTPARGSSEAGDSSYAQTAEATSQYVLQQQQQYWQNYDPNQPYQYTQQWQQGQEAVAQAAQGEQLGQGHQAQGQVQGQVDQSVQDQSAVDGQQAWQQHSQLNASTMQQQQQQQQQWAEWQQQYAADGSYLGYVQQQQQHTPEDAQPANGAQQETQQEQQRRRSSTLSRDEPDAAGQTTNLASSMNSNYTTTTTDTGTTEETEDSQPGTPTPDIRENIDYYAASTKAVSPPISRPYKLPTTSAPSLPPLSTLSSPDSPKTLTPSTPTKTSTPLKGSEPNPALFKFGVPPPQSKTYSGAPPTMALGAAGNKQTLAAMAAQHQGAAPAGQKMEDPSKQPVQQNNNKNKGGSWFGGIMRKIIPKGKNEMKLPDDNDPSIVWDPVAKRWKNTDESEEEQQKSTAPPPKDMELMGAPAPTPAKAPMATPAGAPPPSGNRFSRQKTWGARGQYVDVLAGSASKPTPAAPAHLFNVLPPVSAAAPTAPANIFVPSPGHDAQQNQPQNTTQDDENLSRSSSMSSLSQEVQHIMQGPTSETGAPVNQANEAPPPVTEAPPSGNPAGPPGLPMMFNPSQFSAPQSAASSGGRMKYGQRRAYPK